MLVSCDCHRDAFRNRGLNGPERDFKAKSVERLNPTYEGSGFSLNGAERWPIKADNVAIVSAQRCKRTTAPFTATYRVMVSSKRPRAHHSTYLDVVFRVAGAMA